MNTIEKDKIKKKRGKDGEDLACRYLEKKGYRILERNFRCRMGEIDVIACDGEYICFIEIKARTRTDYGMPRDAVDRRKQQKLLRCTQLYLKLHPGLARQYSPRMDIVEILYREDGSFVRHTPNAFSLSTGCF
ncbi:MAG: YraN family protein [Clostridia bacterium]|nr:YraN family protein [Clostridia bacterium]